MNTEPQVTVAIPTCNRADMLVISLKSALEQDYPNLKILVLDNASTDNTREVAESFKDGRIVYHRNSENIGLFRNWNRALELNDSDYLCILQDDDEIMPGFVSSAVKALELEPDAAFAYTHVRFMDIEGRLLHRQQVGNVEPGRVEGLHLLHRVVAGDNWVIHVSSVMMRKSALDRVGRFDIAHSKHAIEFNLYFRLAALYDFVFVDSELARVRLHEGQDHKNNTRGTGPLAMLAERFDAIAYLMHSHRAKDEGYRTWLAERLLTLSQSRSELTSQLVPDLNMDWSDRLDIAREELARLIPAGQRIVLMDENQWGEWSLDAYQVLPFVEKDGQYRGAPDDDDAGIREIERQCKSGASHLVVGWPAFWMLDYYSGLRESLERGYDCILRNSRVIVYDLQSTPVKE